MVKRINNTHTYTQAKTLYVNEQIIDKVKIRLKKK